MNGDHLSNIATVRYNQAGGLDSTFGTNGKVITTIGTFSSAKSIALQSDGKIIVAGSSFNGNDDDFTLVRYTAKGIIDNSFGDNGIVTTPIESDNNINSIIIQKINNSEKIIIAGGSSNGINFDFALARYNLNGTLDNAFGENGSGIVITSLSDKDDQAISVSIQSNSQTGSAPRIVLAGFVQEIENAINEPAFEGFTTSGKLDHSFGNVGISITPITFSGSICNSIAILKGGKIIAAGSTHNIDRPVFSLACYNSDGSLDHTFGKNGIVITDVGHGEANAVAVQNDGKFLAGGYSILGNLHVFTIVRYNTNGSLDSTFGINGIVQTPIRNLPSDIQSISIQNDGKIIAAGNSFNTHLENDYALVRYNIDGSLDSSYGANGIVIPNPNFSEFTSAQSITIQKDGKSVIGGFDGQTTLFGLGRFNVDGSTDRSFSNDNGGGIGVFTGT